MCENGQCFCDVIFFWGNSIDLEMFYLVWCGYELYIDFML